MAEQVAALGIHEAPMIGAPWRRRQPRLTGFPTGRARRAGTFRRRVAQRLRVSAASASGINAPGMKIGTRIGSRPISSA